MDEGKPDFFGYLWGRVYPNGRVAAVAPLTYWRGRVVCAENLERWKDGIDEAWCYESLGEALAALAQWNGEGEPAGWIRHPQSGRRREGGDPAKETVRE